MSNDIDALTQQKQALVVQLKQLEVQKERLTLRAPEDGRVIKVLAKEGEMVAAGTSVVLLESDRSYYDIYISEKQAQGLSEGDTITGRTVAGDKSVPRALPTSSSRARRDRPTSRPSRSAFTWSRRTA